MNCLNLPAHSATLLLCSKHIMDPEVPQALRLQAILVGGCKSRSNCMPSSLLAFISLACPWPCCCARYMFVPPRLASTAGGVVIIYNKQQGFLLEDCNDMLVRVLYVWSAGELTLTGGVSLRPGLAWECSCM